MSGQKFFAIVVVDHLKIAQNASNKDKFEKITEIQYFGTTYDAAVVELNRIVSKYTSEGYAVNIRSESCVTITNVKKDIGWIYSSRPNRLTKTLSIEETPTKPT